MPIFTILLGENVAKLFGTDGIRGRVGEWPLTPEFFLRLGVASGYELRVNNQKPIMVIGADTRFSNEMLKSALVSGLLSVGVSVYDAGEIPTSGISWLVKYLNADAGAVISASHNPVDQNGIKFFDNSGFKLNADVENRIEHLVLADDSFSSLLDSRNSNVGIFKKADNYQDLYINGLLSEHEMDFLSGLKILVDCANGAAYKLAPTVFEKAGAKVIAINANPSGKNINVAAGSEYVRSYPDKFGALINHFGADFGLAFDGDADRVVFVDTESNLIDGDHILGLLANYLDNENRLLEKSVITTHMRNAGLKHFIENHGMRLFETPVGDKNVVAKILEIQREKHDNRKYGLGGEQSGHIILLNEQYVTGDGIRTALFLMKAFLKSYLKNFSEFAAVLQKTPQIIASAFVGKGERLSDKELQNLKTEYLQKIPGIKRINLRYSGTEPIFRAMLESDNETTTDKLAEYAVEICHFAQGASNSVGEHIQIMNVSYGGLIEIH